MPPLAVDREAVRVLCVALGPREAARRMKLAENTVIAWCARGKWLAGAVGLASAISGAITPQKAAIAATLPPSMRPTLPKGHESGAISPAQALSDAHADLSRRTRGAGLEYAALTTEAAAGEARTAPLTALELAPLVKSAIQSAALAGDWQEQAGPPSLTLNLYTIQGEMPVAGRVIEERGTDAEQA